MDKSLENMRHLLHHFDPCRKVLFMKHVKKKLNYHSVPLLVKKSDWAIFQGKYDVDENGCWNWNRAKIKSTGYGRMGMQDDTIEYAHRASCWFFLECSTEKVCIRSIPIVEFFCNYSCSIACCSCYFYIIIIM